MFYQVIKMKLWGIFGGFLLHNISSTLFTYLYFYILYLFIYLFTYFTILSVYITASDFVFLRESCLCKHICLCVYMCVSVSICVSFAVFWAFFFYFVLFYFFCACVQGMLRTGETVVLRTHKLDIQYQMVFPENPHTNKYFRHVYIHIFI